MANNNEESQKLPVKKKQVKLTAATHRAIKNNLNPLLLLPLLLATVALIIAGIALWKIQATNQESHQNLNNVEENITHLKQLDLQVTQPTIKKLLLSQEQLNQTIEELNKTINESSKEKGYQHLDWMLFKARYYLELAQINAHWSFEQDTTILLLQQADELLKNFTQPEIFSIRQTIAKEIDELKNQPKLDSPGLLSQLDAIQDSILRLPFQNQFNQSSSPLPEASKNDSWRQELKKNFQSFSNLIIIRRKSEDSQLLSPLHQQMLKDSIRMDIQLAKFAILQHDSASYQLNLKQAIQSIRYTFDEKNAATQELIERIQKLENQKLTQDKVNVNDSLELLRKYLDNLTDNVQKGDKSQ